MMYTNCYTEGITTRINRKFDTTKMHWTLPSLSVHNIHVVKHYVTLQTFRRNRQYTSLCRLCLFTTYISSNTTSHCRHFVATDNIRHIANFVCSQHTFRQTLRHIADISSQQTIYVTLQTLSLHNIHFVKHYVTLQTFRRNRQYTSHCRLCLFTTYISSNTTSHCRHFVATDNIRHIAVFVSSQHTFRQTLRHIADISSQQTTYVTLHTLSLHNIHFVKHYVTLQTYTCNRQYTSLCKTFRCNINYVTMDTASQHTLQSTYAHRHNMLDTLNKHKHQLIVFALGQGRFTELQETPLSDHNSPIILSI